jgi:hypothetical protein
MARYSFVKQGNIKHSREAVMEHIKKLQPLNYNKFMWWRTHTDKVVPLGKRAPLKDRILNGEFNPSSYFWQAQLSLYTALDKVNLETDDYQKQIEILQVDMARHKRLMEDFEKEEPARMEALYDAFTSSFRLTREELEEKFLNWSGDIMSFYNHAENFLYTTPAENRKRMRGRPSKIVQNVVKTVQPQIKRKRGRPRKNEMF